jgi:hypothetical protein
VGVRQPVIVRRQTGEGFAAFADDATGFVDGLTEGVKALREELGGFDNTVFREEVDQAVADIIGNPRIPPIEYADVLAPVPVTIPDATAEDGTLRFAPGAPRG